MDPVQFADGSSLIRAYRVKLSEHAEAQFKKCTSGEMQMHFQYIKCWLDKGFNKLDKIHKKYGYIFCDL